MRRIKIIFAFFALVFMASCQKEQNAVNPTDVATGKVANAIAAEPAYYALEYATNGSSTFGQYKKRARKSACYALSTQLDGTSIGSIINTTNTAPANSTARAKAEGALSVLNESSYYPVTVIFSGKNCVVFRGGSSFVPNDPPSNNPNGGDYRINTANGLVRTDYGLSLDLNVNANTYLINNGAYKIISMPTGLKIIQRGSSLTHHEIVPTQEMTVTQYKSLCSQIQSEPSF